ncbi:MAG: hypothetical protein M0D57_09070 [Sphingobacteriales bacterium JAD_PAG50586_3]|nr:MAG: hypothetical protein M0D57_09070 [Sphingobacteriales bacterium JAD_PAG50586_3]
MRCVYMNYLPTIFIPFILFIVWYACRFHRHRLPATSHTLFSNNIWFIAVNIILFTVAAIANFKLDQLFCTPVNWVTIFLALLFLTTLTIPITITSKPVKYLQAIILGSGVFILLYIIAFASYEYLIFMLVLTTLAIPVDVAIRYFKKTYRTKELDIIYLPIIIVITPYFLLVQLAHYYTTLHSKALKRAFIISPVVILIMGVCLALRINYLTNTFTANLNNPQAIRAILNNPVDEYLGELILGAHWKYHTELCMYDGIRPPFHNPILGFAHMLHLHTGVSAYHENFVLYTKVFPDEDITFDCKCSY